MTVPYLIEFRRIFKSLNKKPVLSNVNFSISKGEIVGIIGSSGVGKTTLLRTLIGYYRPDSGQILFNSSVAAQDSSTIRRIFGFTSQDDSIYPELTVAENLRYFATLYGIERRQAAQQAVFLLKFLDLVGKEDVVAEDLSGGMRQRLDIACALIHNPDILIMDEPTAGLDAVTRKDIWQLMQSINRQGKTILFTSHLLDEIGILCHRIAVLRNGTLYQIGSPAKLRQVNAHTGIVQVQTLQGKYVQLVEQLKKAGAPVQRYQQRPTALAMVTNDTAKTVQLVTAVLAATQEKLMDITVSRPTVADLLERFLR